MSTQPIFISRPAVLGIAGETALRAASGTARVHHNDKDPMQAPQLRMPAACTTAAAIRLNAVEPAMEIVAIMQEQQQLLVRHAVLSKRTVELARQIVGFTSPAAERLDHAERAQSYEAVPAIVSEMPSARKVAQRINDAIDALAINAHDDGARDNLTAILETFGEELFEQRFLYHVGQKRTLMLRGEFDRYLHVRGRQT